MTEEERAAREEEERLKAMTAEGLSGRLRNLLWFYGVTAQWPELGRGTERRHDEAITAFDVQMADGTVLTVSVTPKESA